MPASDAPGAHVVIAGVTTRALAISAARAGYRVTAVDGFGDLDLRAEAEVITLQAGAPSRRGPLAAAALAAAVPASLAAYTSNFENYPAAVRRLSRHRRLLGNPPEVLVPARDPIRLMRELGRRGFATPETRPSAPGGAASGSWLLKPRRSGGGHGITIWRRGRRVPRAGYLQEQIRGVPGSIVFAADGRHAVPLGLTRQLVGEGRFGAGGFRYCGSLLAAAGARLFSREREVFETAASLAAAVTSEFGLVGLNGLDFVARDGVPYPLEINPRFSASMELIERAHGLSLFELHRRACQGTLPSALSPADAMLAKAIVFARREVILDDTSSWLREGWMADIPHPGERIRQGRPICTIFAEGSDAASCLRRLTRRASSVYRAAEARNRGAA